ncbi:MAG: Glutaconyl-CoA decarboxylase subunit gamma [Chloroflexi bacterium]|nr:Glutaconyl-CoA decarboxylase subunit gamma [Chloroflexota bacterium]
MKYIAEVEEQEFTIEIVDENHVRINGEVHEIDFKAVQGELTFSLLVNGQSYEANVYQENGNWEVLMRGGRYSVRVEDERARRLRIAVGDTAAQQGPFHLKSPMPGLVVDIPVKEGQEVVEGEVLLILESMKMQNELKSPRAGQVSRIMVKQGENVEQRQVLLDVE